MSPQASRAIFAKDFNGLDSCVKNLLILALLRLKELEMLHFE
jgi:hypothetical protein